VKPWITPVVVFTNSFVEFGPSVKGVRVVNKKYLLQTLQARLGDPSNAAAIWANREQLANHLTGQESAPVQPTARPAMFCPKCGKKMVQKIAKGGKLVAGKPFWVCPDYPKCKTAFPVE
jgi:hypothetical protein